MLDARARALTVFEGEREVKFAITAPVNPSGVLLTAGSLGKTCVVEMTADSDAQCSLLLKTSKQNRKAGHLSVWITVLAGELQLEGSPRHVSIRVGDGRD